MFGQRPVIYERSVLFAVPILWRGVGLEIRVADHAHGESVEWPNSGAKKVKVRMTEGRRVHYGLFHSGRRLWGGEVYMHESSILARGEVAVCGMKTGARGEVVPPILGGCHRGCFIVPGFLRKERV